MNSAQHLWQFLSGKKTYLIALAATVYAWGITHNLWPADPLIATVLAGGGLAALRHGWSTEAAKIAAALVMDPPKLPLIAPVVQLAPATLVSPPTPGSGTAGMPGAGQPQVFSQVKAALMALGISASLMFASGCASSPQKIAYEAYGTTQIAVQTAIATIWEPYVKVYHPPLDQERAVKAGYEKWQSLMAAAGDAGALWAAATASGDTTAIAHALGVFDQAVAEAGQARSDVLDLIQKFSKQPVPGK